jgi:type I restriction-modification system DNA methylase subunit/predicted type IV restriction endonuclease
MNNHKEQARESIKLLIDRFKEHVESYKRGTYNEHQTRIDYINPFFKALGWDMDNEQGFAESYREVIHEDKIKVGSATKAPDYAFTLFGQRKFFVDAKKPSINIKDDLAPAYQVRRYGWSAKVALSIVTDFEEFAIYDCTKKPKPTDKASVARIKYITYEQYLDEFDFLWDIFAKENLPKGRFDKYVRSDTARKGTTTVDDEFLKTIEEWRKYLATTIALANKLLDEDELNFAVQKTIDRIIFLRMCEDRGVEPYGELKKAAEKGEVYTNLMQLFKQADDKYNSGLFNFVEDRITPNLVVNNKVLKTIIKELYYPHCEYEFSVMPADILGSVYERFLGKTIRLTPAHHAKIEEKPEVRKAGGVYYTPKYVVDYIVKHTVGKLLEGKTPKQAENLKICDPACGSGSFLIGTYQYLLDWHLQYYLDKTPVKSKNNPLTPDGKLTTAEKKRILINNIYGVDIDPQAVEVTKLNLLLKALEGETQASINQQMQLFHERVLPNLGDNIKCGNSLVDTDFYSGELDFGEDRKVKPFNWRKAFPNIFNVKHTIENPDFKRQFQQVVKNEDEVNNLLSKYHTKEPDTTYGESSGFDIVIGNPPYGALFSDNEASYFRGRYQTAVWRVESYLIFIEQGLRLLKEHGQLGFIIPDTLLNLSFTQPTREILLRNSVLKSIVGLPSNVFSGVSVDTIILLTEKATFVNSYHPSNVWVKTFGKKQEIKAIENPTKEFYAKTSDWHEQNTFNLQIDDLENTLLIKIEKLKNKLKDVAEMYSGIKAYEVGKGNPPQTIKTGSGKPFTSTEQKSAKWKPLYDGKHIGRYELLWKENNWIYYGEWLAAPRKPFIFEGEKILIRKITGKTLIATYIPETSYCNTLLFVLKITTDTYQYKPLLAILNSKLMGWYFRKRFQISDEDTFPQIMIRDILQFPIPVIDHEAAGRLTKLVDRLLYLNAEKPNEKLPSQLSRIEAEIDYNEEQINRIVVVLYGLTEADVEFLK